jgi:integrase/recombinase XerD
LQAVKVLDEQGILRRLLVEKDGMPVEIVGRFLRFLQNRQMSPNTVAAYARDLTLFFRFLDHRGLAYGAFGPALVVEFLDFLTHLPVRRPGKQQALAVVTADAGGPGRRHAGSSINRTMAAMSQVSECLLGGRRAPIPDRRACRGRSSRSRSPGQGGSSDQVMSLGV